MWFLRSEVTLKSINLISSLRRPKATNEIVGTTETGKSLDTIQVCSWPKKEKPQQTKDREMHAQYDNDNVSYV